MKLATRRTPPTRHGLLAEAAHVVLPSGIVSTAFPAVEATCGQIGLRFDPWQVDLNRCIVAKSADGLYAADTIVMSIPRQVGKTYNIGALVFADCIINPSTTTVWTAHRFKVARETFDSLRAIAKSPLLAPHIDYDDITTGAGNETIPFRNGSRIIFAARERGAIRGFTKVRRLILDEAQILTESALADMVPTMNQAENPQIILMGTPPKPNDPGEVFTNLRTEALAGNAEGVVYVEFSAPKGSDPDDRGAWRVANPSFPRRTPEKAILRMKKLLGDDDFRREGLGIWDSSAGTTLVSASQWANLAEVMPPTEGRVAYGVKFSVDGATVALAVCRRPDEGEPHVEVVEHRSLSSGTAWLADWLVERWRNASEIVVDGKSGSHALVNALRDEKVPARVLRLPKLDEVIAAHTMIYERIRTGGLTHFDQPVLNEAVGHAMKRSIGTAGGWGWKSTSADVDVTPLDAVTLALHGAMTSKRRPGRKQVLL